MRTIRISVIIGTRPEAIKLLPVILAARERPDQFDVQVVRTGQHRELVDQLMEEFCIRPDINLDVMRPNQDLCNVLVESVRGLSKFIAREKPDWVVVQGDTMTTLAGALAGFYNQARVAHVEAGLRTGDRASPFPEEVNRSLTARLADIHFAPTEAARGNLLREGIVADDILVTGNTVVDALMYALGRSAITKRSNPHRCILVTAHRRENHGDGLHGICDGLMALLDRCHDVHAIVPMHPHPEVRDVLVSRIGGHQRIALIEPLGYTAFVAVLNSAALVLTDSGGVQEECAVLGIPMLVLREGTERPEAIGAESSILVGTDAQQILEMGFSLLNKPNNGREKTLRMNIIGDGKASTSILDALLARGRIARRKGKGNSHAIGLD